MHLQIRRTFARCQLIRPAALVALLTFVFLVSTTAALAQDTTGVGAVAGVVTGANRQPSAHVVICVAETTRCGLTDEAGRFRLGDLRAGRYTLQITPPGQASILSGEVEIRAGLNTSLEIELPVLQPSHQTITVTASTLDPPAEIKTSGFLVQPEAVQNSAGSLQDISRYLQSLPGVVAGGEEERNDLIVRGGSPLENLFIVDNIEVPNINSFANFASGGGLVGILDPALLQDVTFLTGGYPASYVNRLSSVLQINLREGDREAFKGTATVGFAGAGVILEGPFSKGMGSWILSARRTFLDLFTDDIGPGGVPISYYINLKALYDLTPRDRVWLVNLTDIDRIHIGLQGRPLDDPTVIKEDIEQDIVSRSSRYATGANWQHIFGERAVGLFGVTYSDARPNFIVKDLLKPGTPIVYDDHSQERELTFKYDLTVEKVPLFGKVQAGVSVKRFALNYQTSSPLGQDNPYSPTPDSNPFELSRAFSAYQPGAYVQATRNITSRLNVTLGGRFDDYEYIGSNRFSPRVAARYRLSRHVAWTASYGRYFQQAPFLFLSAFPENRRLLPLSSMHFVTGLAYTANPQSKLSVEVYRKNYRDYPVSAQFPTLSLANLGDTFDPTQSLMPLVSAGCGQAEGVELFAMRRSTKWNAQASLAWSRTRHAGLDGVLRPGSFDSPFVFNLLAGRRFRQRWAVSGSFKYLSGRPYTPFDETLSRQQGRGIFDLTRVDALRAPAYFRLDLRVDRTWTVRDKPLTVFFGGQNVTNRQNLLLNIWNRTTNTTQPLKQQGFFPVLGLEWRFF